jgi:hypothetical protein
MTKENLGYLYTRVKKPSLSKEEAERDAGFGDEQTPDCLESYHPWMPEKLVWFHPIKLGLRRKSNTEQNRTPVSST